MARIEDTVATFLPHLIYHNCFFKKLAPRHVALGWVIRQNLLPLRIGFIMPARLLSRLFELAAMNPLRPLAPPAQLTFDVAAAAGTFGAPNSNTPVAPHPTVCICCGIYGHK